MGVASRSSGKALTDLRRLHGPIPPGEMPRRPGPNQACDVATAHPHDTYRALADRLGRIIPARAGVFPSHGGEALPPRAPASSSGARDLAGLMRPARCPQTLPLGRCPPVVARGRVASTTCLQHSSSSLAQMSRLIKSDGAFPMRECAFPTKNSLEERDGQYASHNVTCIRNVSRTLDMGFHPHA